LRFVVEEYGGSLDAMFQTELSTLREKLLGVHGIGPETADSILLYAGRMPTFVVDTYTHRVLARHGWIGYEAGYDEIKDYFESALPADEPLYNEYHALWVRLGKDYCRRTNPKCETCPLRELLPAGAIVEPM
jgi:endonuclease-3 related protein